MGMWTRMASRAAFRKGTVHYYKYTNQVEAGSWVGGMVGFKSIVGIKQRGQVVHQAERLQELNYIDFDLNLKTKKLTYKIKDWGVSCSGGDCIDTGTVYATEGYGFLCIPRNITERLVEAQHTFDESDAWLDIWCHTVWQEPNNVFSHIAPSVQFGQYRAILTLETLGHRWRWEKTKVWRFFKKHADAFPLYKLPGSYGCLIFNVGYPTDVAFTLPKQEQIVRILREIRILGGKAHTQSGNDRTRMSRWIAWYSQRVCPRQEDCAPHSSMSCSRVAFIGVSIIRAYFSPCRQCKSFQEDCQSVKNQSPYADEILPMHRDDFQNYYDSGGNRYGRYEGTRLW